MFHPYAQIYGFVKEPTDANRAPPTCLWSKEFYDTDLSRGFVRGYGIQFGRGAGPVLKWLPASRRESCRGRGSSPRLPQLNGHRLAVSAICEDLPEEHNRVTLDPVLKDGHRHSRAEIDYTMSRQPEDDGPWLARGRKFHEAAGATDICINDRSHGRLRMLGTARMGTDPARSVVNRWAARTT